MIYNSKFDVDKIDEKTLNEFRKTGVIVFGTGNYGILTLHALKQKNIKLICFVDNKVSNWNADFKGYKVISPEKLKSDFSNYPVLVCLLNFKYLKRQLRDLEIKKVYDVDFLLSDINLQNIDTSWSVYRCKTQIDLYLFSITAYKDKNKLKVNNLDLVLTEKCSLKCKDCSNLMQYYAKPIDEDFSQLTHSLDKFMDTVDYVQEIRFIGGEPLMYKRIDEVIKKTLTYKNFGRIVIYTNGTIVPKPHKLEAFKNDKIFFRISNYGEISRNVNALEKALEENKILFISERVTKWQDAAIIKKFDRPTNVTKQIFGNCCVNDCLTLLHGKLYLCPFAAHAENLHAIPKSPDETIDFLKQHEKKELKDKIRKLYFEKEYLEACKSCNGRDFNVASVDAAVQTKKPIEYKKVF